MRFSITMALIFFGSQIGLAAEPYTSLKPFEGIYHLKSGAASCPEGAVFALDPERPDTAQLRSGKGDQTAPWESFTDINKGLQRNRAHYGPTWYMESKMTTTRAQELVLTRRVRTCSLAVVCTKWRRTELQLISPVEIFVAVSSSEPVKCRYVRE